MGAGTDAAPAGNVATFGAEEAARIVGGRLLSGTPAARVTGVSADSRTVRPGNLFVALQGERHDAHRFVREALARGAAGAMVVPGGLTAEEEQSVGDRLLIAVPDTLRALGALAAAHRARFAGPVVAVTGSNGKTMTKEMIAAILGLDRVVLKSEGNFNNEVGLPLTLLQWTATHAAAVVELGMNHRGEIARLTAMARPTVGVITNAGSVHLEYLGDEQGVAEAKAELLDGLGAATAVLNADDRFWPFWLGRARGPVISFGLAATPALARGESRRGGFEDAAVRGTVRAVGATATKVVVTTPRGSVEVRVPLPGLHHAANALAATAAVEALGVPLTHVAAGLAAVPPLPHRGVLVDLADGVRLLDDSYNANPASMEAALRTLMALRGSGRAVAVLGDMLELGPTAAVKHRNLGTVAASLGVDVLVAVGVLAGEVVAGARTGGMAPDGVRTCTDADEALRHVRAVLQPGDAVLVKGSRRVMLDRLADALRLSGRCTPHG